jgi:hypothetical protein
LGAGLAFGAGLALGAGFAFSAGFDWAGLRLSLSFILTFLGDLRGPEGRETADFLVFLEPEALFEEYFAGDDFLAVTLAVTECRVVLRWGGAGDFLEMVDLAFPVDLAEADGFSRINCFRAGAFFAF